MYKSILILIITVFATSSCFEKTSAMLEKKTLFSLAMGKAEDQIDLIQIPGIPFNKKSRLVMKNGLFYISNGNTGKIMEFTSYGDIINLYYNPVMNPEPFILTPVTGNQTVSNRRAFPYPFRNIGEMEVTGDGELLVDDEVSPERVEKDKKTGSILNRIILRFSKEGKLLDYLGQEGLGGTPFPYIEHLQINTRGDIIVFTRTRQSRIVFWFSNEGTLLSMAVIDQKKLPVPGGGGKIIAFLDDLTADRTAMTLYLKVDYYKSVADPDSPKRGIPEYENSKIWVYSMRENQYSKSILIPSLSNDAYGNTKSTVYNADTVYQMLGCDSGGRLYFIVHLKMNVFQLLILSGNGTVLSVSDLKMDDSQISYSSFYLSANGLLSALLAKEKKVDIVWWRSDKLTEGKNETAR